LEYQGEFYLISDLCLVLSCYSEIFLYLHCYFLRKKSLQNVPSTIQEIHPMIKTQKEDHVTNEEDKEIEEWIEVRKVGVTFYNSLKITR